MQNASYVASAAASMPGGRPSQPGRLRIAQDYESVLPVLKQLQAKFEPSELATRLGETIRSLETLESSG